MTEHPSVPPLPIARGLRCRCPRCGEGKLFQGFLELRPRCEHCGLEFTFADAGESTELKITVDAISGIEKYMAETWPKALARLKAQCERPSRDKLR